MPTRVQIGHKWLFGTESPLGNCGQSLFQASTADSPRRATCRSSTPASLKVGSEWKKPHLRPRDRGGRTELSAELSRAAGQRSEAQCPALPLEGLLPQAHPLPCLLPPASSPIRAPPTGYQDLPVGVGPKSWRASWWATVPGLKPS